MTRDEEEMKRITVFGGARPRPGEPAYDEAFRLGALLAKSGFTVMTGGYIGTMEAVSRGANEAGGHVIGMTCNEIETWRSVVCNQWVKEEKHFPSLRERLMALIDTCDAAIALPGGVGTLTEISVMWNHLLTNSIAPRPLILVGDGWRRTLHTFFDELGDYVPENQREWVRSVPDIESAVSALRTP
jgi:uncharacterized protein (TIGR00730 family)